MSTLNDLGGISLGEAQLEQAYVAGLQRDLNRHLRNLGATRLLAVDGEWDEHTDQAFRDVCRVLGLEPERTPRTMRLIGAAVARRTRAERARADSDGAAFERELRERFAREGGTQPAGGTPLPAAERERAFVAALQRDLNRHMRLLGTGTTLAVDGEWDEHTARAFRQVCRVLGIAPERTVRAFRLIAGAAASRTAAERARAARQGAAFARELRRSGPPRVVLGGPSLSRDERERAYVAALQRDLNQHLLRLGSPAVLAVDGRWGDHTERAFRQVCLVLGVEPERNPRTYRIVGGALAARTEAERRRAEQDGAAQEKRLREQFERDAAELAAKPPEQKQRRRRRRRRGGTGTSAEPPSDARIAAAIRAEGKRYGRYIVRAARTHGVDPALLCTIIEKESNFSNVFGHDSGKGHTNPIKSPPGRNLEVTEALYKEYLRHRKAGRGAQGVGPGQLTDPGLQNQADAIGGCWRPGPNIMISARFLAGNIKSLGLRQGIRQYNGSGKAAEAYADAVLERLPHWQALLGTGAGATAAGRPRTFRVADPLLEGRDVKAFQRLLNRWYAKWQIPKRLEPDGKFGTETRRAAREIAYGMGIARSDLAGGFTPELRVLMAHPSRRGAEQRERARRRARWRAALRRKYVTPDVTALLGGRRRPQSDYLVRAIVRAHRHGLVVTSTNDGRHAATSHHFRDHAVDFGVAGPLVGTPEHTRRLLRFQHELLQDRPRLLELFGPDERACVKNGVRRPIGGDLAADHKDHVHVAAS